MSLKIFRSSDDTEASNHHEDRIGSTQAHLKTTNQQTNLQIFTLDAPLSFWSYLSMENTNDIALQNLLLKRGMIW